MIKLIGKKSIVQEILIKEHSSTGATCEVNLKPNSKFDNLTIKNGILNINIKELPKEGKANKYLINFLSKKFKIIKLNIEIIRGLKSKKKVILFKNFTPDSLKIHLSDYISNYENKNIIQK